MLINYTLERKFENKPLQNCVKMSVTTLMVIYSVHSWETEDEKCSRHITTDVNIFRHFSMKLMRPVVKTVVFCYMKSTKKIVASSYFSLSIIPHEIWIYILKVQNMRGCCRQQCYLYIFTIIVST